jgi:hypothetical protein
MEKKPTSKTTPAAKIVVAGAVTPKKKKKRYYPSKKSRVQAIAEKGEKKAKLDGNLASAKTAEKAKKEVVQPELPFFRENAKQPEPASFVWVDDTKQTWLQKVVAWLTSIGK